MSLAELLRTKSSEYELLAEWHGERAPLDEEHVVACQARAVVGIVLREVAEAIDVESGEEAGATVGDDAPGLGTRRLPSKARGRFRSRRAKGQIAGELADMKAAPPVRAPFSLGALRVALTQRGRVAITPAWS